jgi:aryl-alcohol dehydrogenase-like predicted oxidoreductase
VLKHAEVSAAIVGATAVEQLEENLKYAEVKLSEQEWEEAEAAIAGPQPKRARAAARSGRAKRPRGR